MHSLKVSISASLYDPQGNLVRKFRPKAAHSFLAQFIEFLHVQMAQTTTNITDITSTELPIAINDKNFRVGGVASDLDYGILIGSGTDNVTIDDDALQSKITTDLTVSDSTLTLSYPTASSRRLAISRTFTNGGAGSMSIEEVALYTLSGALDFFCLDRTLYSVSIPAASSLTLTYRIDVSV